MTIETIEHEEPIELLFTQIFLMAEEFGRDITNVTQVLTAYDNYAKVKQLIEEHGIDDTLIALWGEELQAVAPSILKKDRDAVLAELDAVHEGYIIKGIANDIYTFFAKIIKGVIRFIKTMLNQARRVQATFRKLRKKVDLIPIIDTRQLSYGGYEWKLVHNTLADSGGALLGVPIIDKDSAGSNGFLNTFNAAIEKQRVVLGIRDENRLFTYNASTHTFYKHKAQMGFASLSSAGIENANMLRLALNLIDANLDMVRQFQPAVERFEKALKYLEQEYGTSSTDVMSYVRAHGTYISTYMSTFPPLMFGMAAHFMEVMKQTLVTTKD